MFAFVLLFGWFVCLIVSLVLCCVCFVIDVVFVLRVVMCCCVLLSVVAIAVCFLLRFV